MNNRQKLIYGVEYSLSREGGLVLNDIQLYKKVGDKLNREEKVGVGLEQTNKQTNSTHLKLKGNSSKSK